MCDLSKKTDIHSKPIPMEQVSQEVLKRYIKMRKEVDCDIETIQGITLSLSFLKNSDETNPVINALAIGRINEMLNKHATNIWNTMNSFISIPNAQVTLQEREKNGSYD